MVDIRKSTTACICAAALLAGTGMSYAQEPSYSLPPVGLRTQEAGAANKEVALSTEAAQLIETPSDRFGGSLTVSEGNRYRPYGGAFLNKERGPASQAILDMGIGNVFRKGDMLSGSAILTKTGSKGGLDEADLCFGLTSEPFEFPGGELSARVEYQHWFFPDGSLGDPDGNNFSALSFNHDSKYLDSMLYWSHVFDGNGVRNGDMLYAKILTKPEKLADLGKGFRLTMNGIADFAYKINFLDNIVGAAYIAPLAVIGIDNGKYEFFIAGGYQFNLHKDIPEGALCNGGAIWKF